MKILSRLLLALLVALALDGATKLWAEQTLEPYQPISVFGDTFRFTLGYNTGIAFGMFANGGHWPLTVTGIIIVLLFVWFTRALYTGQFSGWAAWPIGMLLGGAIGNFVDRLGDGRVTDFLDVGLGTARWPTFNLADSFIMIGVGVLMLLSFQSADEESTTQFDSPPPESEADTLLT